MTAVQATPTTKKTVAAGLFKMIGTKKLVRVSSQQQPGSSSSHATPVAAAALTKTSNSTSSTSAFKKIGRRKLVRVKSASGSKMTTPVMTGTPGIKRRNTDGKVIS